MRVSKKRRNELLVLLLSLATHVLGVLLLIFIQNYESHSAQKLQMLLQEELPNKPAQVKMMPVTYLPTEKTSPSPPSTAQNTTQESAVPPESAVAKAMADRKDETVEQETQPERAPLEPLQAAQNGTRPTALAEQNIPQKPEHMVLKKALARQLPRQGKQKKPTLADLAKKFMKSMATEKLAKSRTSITGEGKHIAARSYDERILALLAH